jgi:hypothetical protein
VRKYFSLVILVGVMILSVPSVFAGDEKADQEATKKFKQYVSDLIAHYKAEKHERIEHDPYVCGIGHGYAKAAFEVGTYGIDVRKTDSLITPYVGILELKWDDHYSSCMSTKEKAQAESDLSLPGSFTYRYTYGFQDGKWVAQSREVRARDMEGSGWHWESCEGGNADMFGCAVPN